MYVNLPTPYEAPEQKLKKDIPVYKKAAKERKIYVTDTWNHIFGPFFGSRTDGIRDGRPPSHVSRKGRNVDIGVVPPSVSGTDPGRDYPPSQVPTIGEGRVFTSGSSLPSGVPVDTMSNIIQPIKSPLDTVLKNQPGSDYQLTPEEVERKFKEEERQSNESILKKLSRLIFKQEEEEAKKDTEGMKQNIEPGRYTHVQTPHPRSTRRRRPETYVEQTSDMEAQVPVDIKKELVDPAPVEDIEFEAQWKTITKNHPEVDIDMFKKLTDYYIDNPPSKDMNEKDIVAFVLSELRSKGGKALVIDTPEELKVEQKESEIHVDPSTPIKESTYLRLGVGRIAKPYGLYGGNKLVDPSTGSFFPKVTSTELNITGVPTMIYRDGTGQVIGEMRVPPEYVESVFEAIRARGTGQLTKLLNEIAKKSRQREEPQEQDEEQRKGSEHQEEKAVLTPLKGKQIDDEDLALHFSDLTRKTTELLESTSNPGEMVPLFELENKHYGIAFEHFLNQDTDKRVARWFYPKKKGDYPKLNINTIDGSDRKMIKYVSLRIGQSGKPILDIVDNNGKMMSARPTKSIIDRFFNTSVAANDRLMKDLEKLTWGEYSGGGVRKRGRPRMNKPPVKRRGKKSIKGGALGSETTVVDNPEDAMRKLYVTLGSIESGNDSDDLKNQARVLADYLFDKSQLTKTEHSAIIRLLD